MLPAKFIRQSYHGNLTADANKNISAITYNYLNLPQAITVAGKGTITYTYDAAGNKLKKVTVDNTVTPSKTTTTLYLGGAVFENDELQFIAHEEGRIRPIRDVNNDITGFANDYFLKDHLGNVRMVLTDENKSDPYPAVTFEDDNLPNEQIYYDNVDVERTSRPGPFFTSGTNGSKVQLLRKNTVSIGASQLLKVMAGDNIQAKVDYYIPSQTTDNSNANGLDALLTNLLNLLNGASAPGALHGSGMMITNELNNALPFTDFMKPQGTGVPSSLPKAYLNIIFFDEQFRFVETGSQLIAANTVGTAQHIVKIGQDAAVAQKNGYVYIYVSNESNNLVYFDNLQITHTRGSILEETHYYPFGLTMAGISSKALQFGGAENRFKYNGKEEQRREFSDGSGLEWLDYVARMYDNQIGRWWTVDPMAHLRSWVSPYNFVQNNPINRVDPTGALDDWVQDADGNIKWDKDANSQETTKVGEKYLGKTLTFTFNSYIDGKLWDGPGGSSPAGDKLTSTISLTGNENEAGELTSLSATKSVKIGETPIGTARDYFPGLGSDQNKFGFTGTTLNFEQHASVSPIEGFGLGLMGYDIVNVAQKLTLSLSGNNLSVTAATDIFPSATLTMNGSQMMHYPQPSFKGTHGYQKRTVFGDNGMGGSTTTEYTPLRPAPSFHIRFKR